MYLCAFFLDKLMQGAKQWHTSATSANTPFPHSFMLPTANCCPLTHSRWVVMVVARPKGLFAISLSAHPCGVRACCLVLLQCCMGVFASCHTLRQSLDDDSALIVREHKSPLPHSPSALIMNQRTISPSQNCHTSTKYQCTACINNTLTMFVFSKTGHNLVPGLILVGILPSGYNRATTTGQLVEEGKERVVLQATT